MKTPKIAFAMVVALTGGHVPAMAQTEQPVPQPGQTQIIGGRVYDLVYRTVIPADIPKDTSPLSAFEEKECLKTGVLETPRRGVIYCI